jgi:hypothetical protein
MFVQKDVAFSRTVMNGIKPVVIWESLTNPVVTRYRFSPGK